ncbi:TonB-dependent receptor, partial [Xanthomonas arboricola pv. pruni str. MAFF 311562]
MLGSALWLALGATAAAPAAAQQTGNSGEATQTLDSV